MKTHNCKLKLIIPFLYFIKNIFYVPGMVPHFFNPHSTKTINGIFLQNTVSAIIKLGPIRTRLK